MSHPVEAIYMRVRIEAMDIVIKALEYDEAAIYALLLSTMFIMCGTFALKSSWQITDNLRAYRLTESL